MSRSLRSWELESGTFGDRGPSVRRQVLALTNKIIGRSISLFISLCGVYRLMSQFLFPLTFLLLNYFEVFLFSSHIIPPQTGSVTSLLYEPTVHFAI